MLIAVNICNRQRLCADFYFNVAVLIGFYYCVFHKAKYGLLNAVCITHYEHHFSLKFGREQNLVVLESLTQRIDDLWDHLLDTKLLQISALSWIICVDEILHATSWDLRKLAFISNFLYFVDDLRGLNLIWSNWVDNLSGNLFDAALSLFQLVHLSVYCADQLLSLSTGCMHTVLLRHVPNVEHNTLLIVENHFVPCKAEDLFPLIS